MTKNAIKTSVALDKNVLEEARKLQINISRACMNGLRAEINDYKAYQKSKENTRRKALQEI